MAMEDEARSKILDVLAKAAKLLLSKGADIVWKRAKNVTEVHQMYSTKALVRKNPNQGIHKEAGLTKEQMRELTKELKGYRQDFAIEKNGADGTYNVVVTQGNKSLAENLSEKIKNPEQGERINSVDKLINEAKKVADKINAKNAKERPGHEVLKHRDIGAR